MPDQPFRSVTVAGQRENGDIDVRPAKPRERVQTRLPGGQLVDAPVGTTLGELFRAIHPADAPPVVAALVNGRFRDLATRLEIDAEVAPITIATGDGMRVYRRSMALLLVTAAAELFPDAAILVDHAASTTGAYFCSVQGRPSFTREELERLAARMRELVALDLPVTRIEVPVSEAIEMFRARGEEDKARLLAHRSQSTLRLYELAGRRDYQHGVVVPSTGYLRVFALHPVPAGFLLQFPHQQHPLSLKPPAPYPKLFRVFEEYGRWLDRLGVRGAGALNDAIAGGYIGEVSLVGEALHEARIAEIAREIVKERHRIAIVLVAGPSSSGKTTFAKRLAVQLLAAGLRPYPIALDDYFLERHRTPRDARGELDYECLEALDLERFNHDLLKLMRREEVQLPRYDFITGTRVPGATVTLPRDGIVIVEGIHGLNPALVPELPQDRVYRIYVSALTQLNLDRHNRVSTTDCRLIRRIVRDAATRGYDAAQTIRRWESVIAGEKLHIFPFQENGDAIFNSALAHELAVLRPLADPLLRQVRHDTPEFLEANRLLSFLQWFRPAPADAVPTNSILREFIGGSVLERFSFVNEHIR